ncbi:MAG TPA: TetR/AcrR family transcriptional regulator [Acidobacteriota bacterium]|nr:TetR/AcrR family transcriptional regulator [Acidobacteriota bacterium]
MAPTKLSTEIRKEQLIHGALAVLDKEGVYKLSVARVAREVGIVPSAVYRHYKNKEELLFAMMQHIQTNIYGYINQAMEKTPDPVERLQKILFIQMKFISTNKGFPGLVFSEGFFSTDSRRRERSREIMQGYLQRIAGIVRLGQVQKRIRSDVQPETIAVMFAGLIHSPAILFHLSNGTFNLQKQARNAWKVFTNAIVV